jgi:lanosterol synthase
MFLLPAVVYAWVATNHPIPWAYAVEIRNYLFAHAHPELGGWGLHIEGESTVFGTSLNYTVLRLIGVDAEHPIMIKARGRLHELGGLVRAPHWSKFFHAMLGVCHWDIVNPVPPEIWLLPDWVPISPWRWWVHIRMVFLPMSWIWSKKWTMPETQVIRELRQELFTQPWDTINWAAERNNIAPIDNYHPKSWVLNTVNWAIVNIWNPYLRPKWLAARAEAHVSKLVDMEDANSDYADLASVNGPLNTIMCYIRDGPDSHSYKRHIERLEEFLWVNANGMLVNGTNGVMNWDTAFLIQATVHAGLAEDPKWKPMLLKGLEFLESQQIREDCVDPEICYRQTRKGGWGFSNKDQGYPVSDCVAEAMKSVILLQKTPGYPQLLEDQRIFDAIDVLLEYQNPSGACSSYERTRAGPYLEHFNAAEVFGRIMYEYDYPECTTAVVTALALFDKYWPEYRKKEREVFLQRAVQYIKTAQYPEGGWYGSWGVCFTYGTMFALESLATIGETYGNSSHAKRGCDFLVSKQREDGGWSESYQVSFFSQSYLRSVSNHFLQQSCEQLKYIEHPDGSQVVQTAFALVGLLNADYPHIEPLRKGIKLILDRQLPNGEWAQEALEGVFNNSVLISYPNYKFIFTTMALGKFAKRYPNEKVL